MSTAQCQWEKKITPKKEKERKKKEWVFSPGSRLQALPHLSRLTAGKRKRREDRMVSSHLKRGWPALLITLTLRNQEKPIYLKTKAFDNENETILEYFVTETSWKYHVYSLKHLAPLAYYKWYLPSRTCTGKKKYQVNTIILSLIDFTEADASF